MTRKCKGCYYRASYKHRAAPKGYAWCRKYMKPVNEAVGRCTEDRK